MNPHVGSPSILLFGEPPFYSIIPTPIGKINIDKRKIL